MADDVVRDIPEEMVETGAAATTRAPKTARRAVPVMDELTDHGYDLLPNAWDGTNAPGDGDWSDDR